MSKGPAYKQLPPQVSTQTACGPHILKPQHGTVCLRFQRQHATHSTAACSTDQLLRTVNSFWRLHCSQPLAGPLCTHWLHSACPDVQLTHTVSTARQLLLNRTRPRSRRCCCQHWQLCNKLPQVSQLLCWAHNAAGACMHHTQHALTYSSHTLSAPPGSFCWTPPRGPAADASAQHRQLQPATHNNLLQCCILPLQLCNKLP
jgi:hypothetical protein